MPQLHLLWYNFITVCKYYVQSSGNLILNFIIVSLQNGLGSNNMENERDHMIKFDHMIDV